MSGTTRNSTRGNLGRARPIIRVAFDHYVLVLDRSDKTKWSGANGLLSQFPARTFRHDSNGGLRQVKQEGCMRFVQAEYHREVVRRFNGGNTGEGCALDALQLSGEQALEGVLHVAGGQRFAIVEPDSGAQMKYVRHRVRRFPALCQPGVDIRASVPAQKAVKNQRSNTRRLGVCPDPGVEVQGT